MNEMQIKVNQMINERITPENPRPRIFLPKEEWLAFYKEVEPIYIERYGAMVQDEKALKDGFDNIRFQGCAICLSETTEPPHQSNHPQDKGEE